MRRSDLLACALAVTLGAGCAAKATTVERTETVRSTEHEHVVPEATVVERREVVVTEGDPDVDGCGGVLSCSVEFVGDVVAFPFRLTAGVIGAIF